MAHQRQHSPEICAADIVVQETQIICCTRKSTNQCRRVLTGAILLVLKMVTCLRMKSQKIGIQCLIKGVKCNKPECYVSLQKLFQQPESKQFHYRSGSTNQKVQFDLCKHTPCGIYNGGLARIAMWMHCLLLINLNKINNSFCKQLFVLA